MFKIPPFFELSEERGPIVPRYGFSAGFIWHLRAIDLFHEVFKGRVKLVKWVQQAGNHFLSTTLNPQGVYFAQGFGDHKDETLNLTIFCTRAA